MEKPSSVKRQVRTTKRLQTISFRDPTVKGKILSTPTLNKHLKTFFLTSKFLAQVIIFNIELQNLRWDSQFFVFFCCYHINFYLCILRGSDTQKLEITSPKDIYCLVEIIQNFAYLFSHYMVNLHKFLFPGCLT